MRFPLSEFEQFVDENILQRGLAYFKSGAITDFSDISNGEYEALVSGTEEYTVRLEVENNTVIAQDCDCPYDMGPICKHIVAVILHVRKYESELNQLSQQSEEQEKNKIC